MDFIWMAFYYLLRPGKCYNASCDAQRQFCLKDVSILVGDMHIKHAHLSTLDQLQYITLTSMYFTT